MPLSAPTRLYTERILSFGASGQGKSYDAYTIMRLSVATGSDAQFHIIDTDESAGRMLSDPGFTMLLTPEGDVGANIHVYDVRSLPEVGKALADIYRQMRKHDWLLIDMTSPFWTMAQNEYSLATKNQTLSQALTASALKKEQEKKKQGMGLDASEINWQAVTASYDENFAQPIKRCPGHLFGVAEVKALGEKESQDTRATFGPIGVMPAGHKRDAYLFHTVLWKMAKQGDTYRATTVKDRSRPTMEAQPINDFAMDYLVGIAGWKI